jgi:phospholipid/cholesterol/gamma-HCH transport system substrate-binding protein
MSRRSRDRSSRRTARTFVKLVLFAAACLTLTGWLALKIGNIHLFAKQSGYSAVLSDATGLRAGDAVEIAGVKVGQVTSVGVQRGSALVTFALDRDVRIRTSTGVGIRWLDVLGDKVLYLYPGQDGTYLATGGQLPESNDVADGSVGALLDAMSPFLGAIDPQQANEFVVAVSDALDGNEAGISSLLNHAASVSTTLGDDNAEIGAVIDEYQQVAGALASHRGDIATVLDNIATLAHGLAGHNATLDTMVGDLAAVTKDLGGLLASNKSNLDGTISNVDAVAREVEQHEGALAQTLRTLPSGLAPYEEISSYGQWFEIQVVYSCVAAEAQCSYYQPTNEPAGSSPLPVGSLPGLGGAGSGSAGGASGAAGLAGLFQPIAGVAGTSPNVTGVVP